MVSSIKTDNKNSKESKNSFFSRIRYICHMLYVEFHKLFEKNNSRELNGKLVISTVTILTFGAILLVIAFFQNPSEFAFTVIFCLLGAILGWFLAMIVTPYGQTDETNLQNFAKIIGSFVSGYILSKIDKVIQNFVDKEQYTDKLVATRLVLFICFFFLFAILVYSYRSYRLFEKKPPQGIQDK